MKRKSIICSLKPFVLNTTRNNYKYNFRRSNSMCIKRRVVLPMWGRPINDVQEDDPANLGSSYEG
ncbi:hypothetical protein LINPERHAP2_LOCUS10802 [Linum perenne]